MNYPIIFDGAFGTFFYEQTALREDILPYPELANEREPDTVLKIHKAYLDSGVNAIKTNTFGINTSMGLSYDECKVLITKGFSIAKEAVGVCKRDVYVFADLGPLIGDENEYLKLCEYFIEAGATHFLFETLNDCTHLDEAFKLIKRKVEKPFIIASFAVYRDGYSKSGGFYKSLINQALDLGADCAGLNCICGPTHMLSLFREFDIGDRPLIAMPNASYPSNIGSRTVYPDNPQYFASKTALMFTLGVKALGGCCGTTPKHTEALVKSLAQLTPVSSHVTVCQEPEKPLTGFKNKLIIAVEVSPPSDTDVEYIIKAAEAVRKSGADFVTVPDSPMGKPRANSFMISSLIKRSTGIDVMPHLCCRDKNQVAIKGDLTAGNIDGLRHVLAITGDRLTETDRGSAKNVFGFNSYNLISYIRQLNEDIFRQTPYTVAGALNINATNFQAELKRAVQKIECGVDALFSQPIFSERNLENFLTAREILKCKLMAGIMPIAGYKNAVFLNNEVPGIEIPQEIIDELKEKSPKDARQICLEYCMGIVDKLDHNCDGYYIITPLKKIDYSVKIVQHILGNF